MGVSVAPGGVVLVACGTGVSVAPGGVVLVGGGMGVFVGVSVGMFVGVFVGVFVGGADVGVAVIHAVRKVISSTCQPGAATLESLPSLNRTSIA